MLIPNRHDETGNYRYGFQGQEQDDEVKGEGNSLNYTFRMHDPRVGRFFAVDPLASKYPHNSPYAFSENIVIDGTELEGAEWKTVTHHLDIHPDGSFFIVKTDVSINQNVTFKRGSQEYAVTNVKYKFNDEEFDGESLYELITENVLKPSAGYDYSEEVIEDKLSEDWEYVKDGESKLSNTAYGRWEEILERDLNAPDNAIDVQDLKDLTDVLSRKAPPTTNGSSTSATSALKNTKHTVNRHVDKKKYPEKSKYSKPSQLKKLQKKTVNKPDRVTKQKNGRTVYERDFKRKIGTRGETSHKVVKDKKGKVVTSYPQKKPKE